MPTVALKKKGKSHLIAAKLVSRKMNKLVRDPLTGLMIQAKRSGQKLFTSEDAAHAVTE